ncbi:hypothetical protein FA10DRAFT_266232 [Acaromyces ingoldii]|uniref:Uncharacterized protein n=1 Tax=Acaromyces ingoldii TaxID=215250 RepID=A0A316YXF2_9BASI|nr:hypothetical protein FA10DRAFT_266232 [Acaromyces ingoldii]PWN92475.1 hypothetical protein FA10DRAFT_266232 [Acaromyces ingoldii]
MPSSLSHVSWQASKTSDTAHVLPWLPDFSRIKAGCRDRFACDDFMRNPRTGLPTIGHGKESVSEMRIPAVSVIGLPASFTTPPSH